MANNRIIPTGAAQHPVMRGLRTLYHRAGIGREAAAIEARVLGPQLATDYAVVQDVIRDLHEIDGLEALDAFGNFRRAVGRTRASYHRDEVRALHDQYSRVAGPPIVKSEKYGPYLSALLQGRDIVRGTQVISSSYFGEIDLGALNRGIGAFKNGSGQINLSAALAVATGRFDWSLSTLPPCLLYTSDAADES